MKHLNKQSKERGFTIIELMMATSVLSIILLMVTAIMLNIGRLYFKGLNTSRIQDAVRSVNDEVAEQLQLNGNTLIPATSPNGTVHAFCIGTMRYVYKTDIRIGTGPGLSKHVLWREPNPDPAGCPQPANDFLDHNPTGDLGAVANNQPNTRGAELVPGNSRLTWFKITGSPPSGYDSPYRVELAMAYAVDDPADPSDDLLLGAGLSTHCKGVSGSEFCAVAKLETSVAKRKP